MSITLTPATTKIDVTASIIAATPVATGASLTPQDVARRIMDGVYDGAADRFFDLFEHRPDVTKRSGDRMVIRRYILVLGDIALYAYDRHPDWSVNDRVIHTLACIEQYAHMPWPKVQNEHTL